MGVHRALGSRWCPRYGKHLRCRPDSVWAPAGADPSCGIDLRQVDGAGHRAPGYPGEASRPLVRGLGPAGEHVHDSSRIDAVRPHDRRASHECGTDRQGQPGPHAAPESAEHCLPETRCWFLAAMTRRYRRPASQRYLRPITQPRSDSGRAVRSLPSPRRTLGERAAAGTSAQVDVAPKVRHTNQADQQRVDRRRIGPTRRTRRERTAHPAAMSAGEPRDTAQPRPSPLVQVPDVPDSALEPRVRLAGGRWGRDRIMTTLQCDAWCQCRRMPPRARKVSQARSDTFGMFPVQHGARRHALCRSDGGKQLPHREFQKLTVETGVRLGAHRRHRTAARSRAASWALAEPPPAWKPLRQMPYIVANARRLLDHRWRNVPRPNTASIAAASTQTVSRAPIG